MKSSKGVLLDTALAVRANDRKRPFLMDIFDPLVQRVQGSCESEPKTRRNVETC
jgi:hypothetical protein